MNDTTLQAILIPLAIIGAGLAVYMIFRFHHAWRKLAGTEIKVSNVAHGYLMFNSHNSLTAAVKIVDDKILLKVPALSLGQILRGKLVSIPISSIIGINYKKGWLFQHLKISSSQSNFPYWISADLQTLRQIENMLLERGAKIK